VRFPARCGGHRVDLFEMRPAKMTPAHQTSDLAEWSARIRSDRPHHQRRRLLKREMQFLGSLVIRCGEEARVPAGDAFAVDRERFSPPSRKLSLHMSIFIVMK